MLTRSDDWTSAEFRSWFFNRHLSGCRPTPDAPVLPIKLHENYADCNWLIEENNKNHHTEDYCRTDSSLVARRGAPIKFIVRLNRNFDSLKDEIKIELQVGPNPRKTDGTHIICDEKSTNWNLTIDHVNGSNVTCSIKTPSNAMIGRYKCAIYLETGSSYSDGGKNKTPQATNSRII